MLLASAVAAAVEVMAAAEQEAEGSAPVVSEEAVMDSAEVLLDAVDSQAVGQGGLAAEGQEDWQEEPDAAGWAEAIVAKVDPAAKVAWLAARMEAAAAVASLAAPKVVQQVVERAVEMAARQEAAVEVAHWAGKHQP